MGDISKLVPAIKSGRAWNGAHRDAGTVIHLVERLPENTSGYWGDKALCGAILGSRSNRWTESRRDVNCFKCLIKLFKYHESTKLVTKKEKG